MSRRFSFILNYFSLVLSYTGKEDKDRPKGHTARALGRLVY